MSVHPIIEEADNPYSRHWWGGWLIGVLMGIAITSAVYLIGWLLGRIGT